MYRILFLYSILCLAQFYAHCQIPGNLSGGFESNSQYYHDDTSIEAIAPDEKFASNNYLKLDYYYGSYTIGIRYETYRPPLIGYPTQYDGSGIAFRYFNYKNELLDITAGNFYEQFGSGLILRTYEERLLGFDNSLDGFRIKFSPSKSLSIKAILGKQREYFDFGDGVVRGLDLSADLAHIIKMDPGIYFDLGASIVSKFEEFTGPDEDIPEIVDAFSGRFNFGNSRVSISAEYVKKGSDPTATNQMSDRNGDAVLLNIDYTSKGFGVSSTFRRLDNMDFRSERNASQNNLWINFIPTETRQHTYALANIYPYASQALGEIGGQINVSYNLPRNSQLGGKFGTQVAINFSRFNDLKKSISQANGIEFDLDFISFGENKLYQDFNIEISRKINKNFKSTISYIMVDYNKEAVEGVPSDMVRTNIAVAELLVKFPKKRSLRVELQHLWTRQDQKNWAAFMAEYSVAPKWSVFVLDQFNYGSEKAPHYYTGGFSYTNKTTRISANYGRQRGGLLCVGGVCRFVPFASGISMSITSSF